MTTKLKPTGNNVIVEPLKAEDSGGAVYIPDAFREKSSEGRVIAVGPGKDGKPLDIAVGDRVLLNRYAGHEIVLDGVLCKAIDAQEIIAVIAPAPAA